MIAGVKPSPFCSGAEGHKAEVVVDECGEGDELREGAVARHPEDRPKEDRHIQHQRSDGQSLNTRRAVNDYKKSRRPGARRTTR